MRPESFVYTPVSTLIRVDLPAPFCPISACTSPRATSKSASSSAGDPRNRLVMPRIDSRGDGPSATGEPFRGRHGLVPPGPGVSPAPRRHHRRAQYALSTLSEALSLVNSWSELMISVLTGFPDA